MCVSVTGNAMSVPCELVAHHRNRRPRCYIPACAHLLLITCKANGTEWGVWRGHRFSGLGGADCCGAGVFSVLTHLVRVSSCGPDL